MTSDTHAQDLLTPERLLREHTRHEVRQRLAKGTLVRLHDDWDLTAAEYEALYSEERHLLAVTRTSRAMRTSGAAASYESAAVIHGLPLFRTSPRRVHLTVRADATTRSHPLVFRHRDALPEEDVEVRGGLSVTTLDRTAVDAVRAMRPEAALALADAAVRRVAWDDEQRTYDERAAESFRDALWQRIVRMPRHRGIRQARTVVEIADGRAESPGESVMRLYLLLLGFAPPRLQVSVPGPGSRTFRIDGALDDVGFWWEFDGAVKYNDPEMTGGMTFDELIEQQQWRQEWIVATTGRPFTRCSPEHLESLDVFAAKLRADGVPLPLAHVLPLPGPRQAGR